MPFNPKADHLETWQQATAALQIVVPYLAPLIDRLTPVPVPGIGETIACDASARVFFAPEYAKKAGLAVFAADLAHELIVHVLPNHHERALALGVSRRDIWNRAADYSGNGTVFALAQKHPGALQPGGVNFSRTGSASDPATIARTRWLHPCQAGLPDGLLAEDYYDALLKAEAAKEEEEKKRREEAAKKPEPQNEEKETGDNEEGSDGDDGDEEEEEEGKEAGGNDAGDDDAGDDDTDDDDDGASDDSGSPVRSGPDGTDCAPGGPGAGHGRCGSCATGGDDLTTRLETAAVALYGELPSGPSPEETQSLRIEVAERVEAHEAAHGKGTVPGGIRRTVEALRQPARVDWRRRLAVLLRDGIGAARGASDWSMRRPRWRAGIGTPRLHAPDGIVALVADTSGSMGADDLRRVLTETDAVMKSGVVRDLWWIPTDTRADQPRKIRRMIDAAENFTGGGGTAMTAGLEAAAQLRPSPHLTIVVTDGETDWPAEKPAGLRRVLVVLTRSPQYGAPIPAWATVARAYEEFPR